MVNHGGCTRSIGRYAGWCSTTCTGLLLSECRLGRDGGTLRLCGTVTQCLPFVCSELQVRDPFRAAHIKHITVQPVSFLNTYLIYPRFFGKREGLRCQPASMMKRLIEPFSTPTSARDHLPALQSLRVECSKHWNFIHHYIPFTNTYKPFLRNAILSIVTNLRSLILNIPLEAYWDTLDLNLHFPNLEHFEFTVYIMYFTTDHGKILGEVLAPFVNRHTTLTSLSILFDDVVSWMRISYAFDFPALFRSLTHLPCLSTLHVRLYLTGPKQTDLSGLCQFLQQNTGTLRTLTLHLMTNLHFGYRDTGFNDLSPYIMHTPYTPHTLFAEKLFTETIPALTALRSFFLECLQEDTIRSSIKTFKPVLQWFAANPQFAARLERLAFPGYLVEGRELGTLFETVSFGGLRTVDFRVARVDVRLLDIMEMNVPGLEKLTITASEYVGRESGNDSVRLHIFSDRSPANTT